MTSPASPLTSVLSDFAGGSSRGLLAGVGPMIPALLNQAAAQLQGLSAEEIDGALTVLAEWLLAARSVRCDLEVLEAPAHNLD